MRTISLGRILGISVRLDYSWFLIFALMTWMLATIYFPLEVALPTTAYWILGALTAVLFCASVLLHELGHSVMAIRFGTPVRRSTLFIFGGVAEITSEPPGAFAEILIALAGPLVSFVLAAAWGVLAVASGALAPLFILAKYLSLINGSLALFNLIPGFPLDGGRVLRAIVWSLTGSLSRVTTIAAMVGRISALFFIVFGIWQIFDSNPVGLWIALIGWFLQGAAARQLKRQELHDWLASHPVTELMAGGYVRVTAETTLQELVDRYVGNVGARAFIVERNGAVVGLVTWRHVNAVPRADWQTITAAQAMTPIAKAQSVQLEEKTGQRRVHELLVVASDRHLA